MKFTDFEKLAGEVIITAKDSNGRITTLVDDKNLIVLNGRNNVANAILTGSCPKITTIAFGTGGTVAGSPSQVIPVLPTDYTLTAPIPGLSPITDFTFNTDASSIATSISILGSEVRPKIVFNILIPETTSLNGVGVNEIALMFNDSPATAFAIKRFSTINKSDSIAISITWTIYF